LGRFEAWDVLRLGTFFILDVLGLGRFEAWDVLRLGRFEAGTYCSLDLMSLDILYLDVLQLGRYVFERFVCAPEFELFLVYLRTTWTIRAIFVPQIISLSRLQR
jgi:hypothetical protein